MAHKVCVVLVDRANYGRLMPLMLALDSRTEINMQIICGGSMVLRRFHRPADMVRDQFGRIDAEVYHELEGNTHATMAKSLGLGVSGYVDALERLQPDAVLLIGDRYEAVAAALAAHYTRRPIVHLQGGERSGTLDDAARNVITQLAKWHIPATQRAAMRLDQQWDKPTMAIGCPSADLAKQFVGIPREGHILIQFHSDTANPDGDEENVQMLLEACEYPSVFKWLWPNIDAGSDRISKMIRRWRERNSCCDVEWIVNLDPVEYQRTIATAGCCVGNSSSFVRDAGYYGTPVILLGDRQYGRQHGDNVVHGSCRNGQELYRLILSHSTRRFEPSWIYGRPGISARITDFLIATLSVTAGSGESPPAVGGSPIADRHVEPVPRDTPKTLARR